MLKVGYSVVPHKQSKRVLGYDLVIYEENGFADVNKYTPIDFDMCVLITSEGKHIHGWWTGQEYFSHRMLSQEVIVSWRKCRELS